MKLDTIAVHAGPGHDPATGGVSPPLHLSTTFARDEALQPIAGYTYQREGNPTQTALEEALAPLEGGATALVFASGMAAGMALFQALPPGSHVVLPAEGYHGIAVAGREFLPRWGIDASFVEATDLAALQAALRPTTKLVLVETPSNPMLRVVDLATVCALVRRAGAMVAVDSTFATPVLQRPIELGAHVVLHSTTKYFGGHSDVLGGALIFAEKGPYAEAVLHVRHILGAVASPFNAWLILRGLRTLPCRVRAQSATALTLARALEHHPAVASVCYPGLPSSHGHELASRQMSAFGAMMSVRLAGGREAAVRAVSRVKLFTRATSLGGVESLIEHRATSEGPDTKTPQDLVRLSVGLEDPEDLLADLLQALA